jgi:hypothetical protein
MNLFKPFALLIMCASIPLVTVGQLSIASESQSFNYNTVPNLSADIKPKRSFFTSLNDAISTFNNARSKDPSVLSNKKQLILPASFINMNWVDQYYTFLNLERTDRGLLPNTYPISRLNTIANSYASDLLTANQFTHTLNGTTPQSRMKNNTDITGCIEFHPYSESLYYFGTTDFNMVNKNLIAFQALYTYIYNDSSSAWGHRKHLLSNYNNNNKSNSDEGHLGIGMSVKKFNGMLRYILVQNTFDPKPSCNL